MSDVPVEPSNGAATVEVQPPPPQPQQEAVAENIPHADPAPVEPIAASPESGDANAPAEPVDVPSTTTASPPAVVDAATRGGVCPIKPEYIRPAPQRVVLDSEGKTRGMNKGTDRQISEAVQGTQRPTFEGERNFFAGAALHSVKAAIRSATQKGKGGGKGNGGAQQQGGGAKRPREEASNEQPAPTPETIEQVNAPESTESSVPITTPQTTDLPAPAAAESAAPLAPNVTNGDGGHSMSASDRVAALLSEESRRERAERGRGLFKDKLVLAPLTTVGNLPFRRICKQFGADVTIGEMAVVYNLNHMQKSEWSLLRRHESEDVFGIQIAVSGPRDAAAFADAIKASDFSYDYIEINCGCPVDTICSRGCGCGLFEKKGRLREVVQNLAVGQSQPVVVKCRIGADESAPSLHRQIHEYSGWGASAVTVHGRSKRQRYTKFANWSYVNECAQLADVPVIGNGDIFSYEDIVEHRATAPSISGHMIGRGALIKPWIFREIKERQTLDISSHERLEMLREFAKFGLAHWGADERGVLQTRRFLCEWLSFLCRYVPVGLLERLPQRINERPPYYEGRDELETLMSSDSVMDWIRISELLLGPAGDKFRFTPKHKSNSFATSGSAGLQSASADAGLEAEG